MASEVELERLIVRLMGDGTAYQKMLAEATTVTDQLGQEMKRLGGTEAEFTAITTKAAATIEAATEAMQRHTASEKNLQALMDAGLIARGNLNKILGASETVLDAATNAVVKHNDAMARGLQITKASETPLEAYKRKIAELDKLIVAGAISQETYNRTAEALNAKLPRTIALEKERVAALKASTQAQKEADRAAATAQKQYAAAEKQLSDAIREGAMAEQRMIKQDQAAQLRTARQASLAAADAERERAKAYRHVDAAIRDLTNTQDKFNSRLAIMRRSIENANNAVNTLGRDVSRAGMNLRGFGTSWSIYVSAPLGAFLTASTMAGVKMDSLTRGLTAITHSAAETNKQIEDMLQVALLPGLGFKEVMEGNIRLQATGFSANLAKRSLLAFGNALATVGKGKADLDGVLLALTQISAKGKVFAQEINQLGERVPQIRKIMENVFGTANTEEIQKMGLTSKEFIEMIVTELERLPKVTGGALNDFENFSDAAFVALSKVGKSILEVLVPTIRSATEWVKDLGDWFTTLSPRTRILIIEFTALMVAIGPVAVITGQLTIAVGGLITIYQALTTVTWALAAAQGALYGSLALLIGAGLIFAIREVTGLSTQLTELNIQMAESARLSETFGEKMKKAGQDIIAMADAMEGPSRAKMLEEELEKTVALTNTYSQRLEAAKKRLQHAMRFGDPEKAILPSGRGLAEVQSLKAEVKDLTEKFEAQNSVAKALRDSLAQVIVPSQLESIKQQTALKKETDNYIKSIERKIEVLTRGESATKIADLAARHAALGMEFSAESIQKLIDKEDELKKAKEARAESDKLGKDIESLNAKLRSQIEAFGGVKYSTEIQALADRDLAGAFTEALRAADGLAKKLDELKEQEKLADDTEKLVLKLRAEIAELKGSAESSEAAALAARGLKGAKLELVESLEKEKKALKEAADLQKDITTFTENLQAQIATFGMASEEADLYKFAMRGATEAQLAAARAAVTQKTAMEANKKLMEDAKRVNEKFDPKTKFINEYAELNKMLKAGAISTEVFQKATKELQDDLLEAQEKADVHVRFTVEGNEAVRAGSAEFIKMLSEVEQRAKDVGISKAMAKDIAALNADLTATAKPTTPVLADMDAALAAVFGEAGAPSMLFGGMAKDAFTPDIGPGLDHAAMMAAAGWDVSATGKAEDSVEDTEKEALSVLESILEAIQEGNDEPPIVINNIGG